LPNIGNAVNFNKVMVIILNTMVCNTKNLNLLSAKGDIAGQLAWLKDKLAEAKSNGNHVFIIGHMPPGSAQCNSKWA